MIETDGYKFLTLREARDRLKISEPTIRENIRQGKIKASFFFGRWYIPERHLLDFIKHADERATTTAAAFRAANRKRRDASVIRRYAIGVYSDDLTDGGFTAECLKIIPIDVTPAELKELQDGNYYVFTSEPFAKKIRAALMYDGFTAARVPVFDKWPTDGKNV